MNGRATYEEEYILLIGDIHANDAALAAVIGDAYRRYAGRVLKTWFLGDLFGRGPRPGQAYRRLLNEAPEAMVKGNHEGGLVGKYQSVRFEDLTSGLYNGHDWEVLLLQREELHTQGLLSCSDSSVAGGEVADFINQLPVVCLPRPSIAMVHGGHESAFVQPTQLEPFFDQLVWDYVKEQAHADYTIDAIQWLVEERPAGPEVVVLGGGVEAPQLILVGHYHMRFLYDSNTGDWHSPVNLDETYNLTPSSGGPIVLSPGSVGFPRERNRDASYAVLKLENGQATAVTFHTCAYDRDTVRNEMVRKGYPDETVRRLRLKGESEQAQIMTRRASTRNCSPEQEMENYRGSLS